MSSFRSYTMEDYSDLLKHWRRWLVLATVNSQWPTRGKQLQRLTTKILNKMLSTCKSKMESAVLRALGDMIRLGRNVFNHESRVTEELWQQHLCVQKAQRLCIIMLKPWKAMCKQCKPVGFMVNPHLNWNNRPALWTGCPGKRGVPSTRYRQI